MNIQILSRNQLDTEKYNRCISLSDHPMPYAFSEHLDLVAWRWKVVVSGEYDAVMPFAYNRKLLGVPQIYHPPYAQQLGVFGRYQRDVVVVKAMLNALSKLYVRVQMQMNAANPLPSMAGWLFRERTNFELDLNKPYLAIKKGYRKGHLANIKSAHKHHVGKRGAISPDAFAKYESSQKGTIEFGRLSQLIELYGRDSIWSAHLEDGQLGAAGFFPELNQFGEHSQNRVVYMIGFTTDVGRKAFSAHFLLDSLIQHYANQPVILDFEGSELPGVARFFKGFGPQTVPYLLAQR